MVAFERAESSHYVCNTKLVELSKVANFEKVVPDEWITKDGNFVTEDFVRYAMPLIQGESAPPMEDSLPRFARLKKVRVPQL
jgi:6-phosphofructokinase 1